MRLLAGHRLPAKGLILPGHRLGGRTFTPAALFANGEPGVWLDPSDPATVFSDTAGTTQAGIVDPVAAARLLNDDTLAVQATLASRPILGRLPETGRRNLLISYGEGVVVSGTSFNEAITESVSQFNYPTFKLVRDGEGGGGFGRNNQTVYFNEFAVDAEFRVQTIVKPTSNTDVIIGFQTPGGQGGARTIGVVVKPDGSSFTFERAAQGAAVLSSTVESVGQGAFLVKAEIRTSTIDLLRAFVGLGDTNVSDGQTQENIEYAAYFADVQFEVGGEWTTPQHVVSEFDVTEAGVPSLRYLGDPGAASLPATVPDLGTDATLAYATEAGVTILTGQTIGAGALEILRGDRTYGVIANNRPWTAAETAGVTKWLNARIPA